MNEPSYYRRNLPHIQPLFGYYFITFRLHDSMPYEQFLKIKEQYISELGLEPSLDFRHQMAEKYFYEAEELCDNYPEGPKYLQLPAVAQIVKNALNFHDGKQFDLISYCIMPNHVHVIMGNIQKSLFKLLQSIKRYSAYECNKHLNRSGPFWQKESYDHLIRNRNELADLINYILYNPVKARLVKEWEDWPNTFCKEDFLE